jgi:hypothetical protein
MVQAPLGPTDFAFALNVCFVPDCLGIFPRDVLQLLRVAAKKLKQKLYAFAELSFWGNQT